MVAIVCSTSLRKCVVVGLLLVSIILLLVDGDLLSWNEGHQRCYSSSFSNTSVAKTRCEDASYMVVVRKGLENPKSPQHHTIYAAIDNLYKDLEDSSKPRSVDLGKPVASGKSTVLIHPVSFCIPDENILRTVPAKGKLFGQVVPGDYSTYFHLDNETMYYEDMRRSYFTLTHKKNGWDCLRHLEIMAAGSIPYFLGIKHCPSQSMAMYPKKLFEVVLDFPGLISKVARNPKNSRAVATEAYIDHSFFDKDLYAALAAASLQYTTSVMSTRAMAKYVINRMRDYSEGALSGSIKSILYLTHQDHDMDKGDYMTDFLLHGLKVVLGNSAVVDFPKRDMIYNTVAELNETDYRVRRHKLYGYGFSWSLKLDDFGGPEFRTHDAVKDGIVNRKFDMVILGSGHRDGWASKLFYWDLVCKHYKPAEVAWVCGSDKHTTLKRLIQYSPCAGHLFSREGAPDTF